MILLPALNISTHMKLVKHVAGLLLGCLLLLQTKSFASHNTNIRWAEKLPFAETITDVAVKPNGSILVCGTSSSASLTGYHGQSDVFIAECTSSGNLLWARAVGGSGNEYDATLAIHSDTYFLLTVRTYSHDGDFSDNQVGAGSFQSAVLWMNAQGGIFRKKYLFLSAPIGSFTQAEKMIFSNNHQAVYLAVQEAHISLGTPTQTYYFQKIDTTGNIQWTNYLNASFNAGAQHVFTLSEKPDHTLIACGSTTDVAIGFVHVISPTGQSIPVSSGTFGWGRHCMAYLGQNNRCFVLHTADNNPSTPASLLRSELLPNMQIVPRDILQGIDGDDLRAVAWKNDTLTLCGFHSASLEHPYNKQEDLFISETDSSFSLLSYALVSGEGPDMEPVMDLSGNQKILAFTSTSNSLNGQPLSSCGNGCLAAFQGMHRLIGLRLYFDENHNHTYDLGEGLKNKMVCDSTSLGREYVMTNAFGNVAVTSDASTHFFRTGHHFPSYVSVTPAAPVQTGSFSPVDTSLSIREESSQEVYDLQVDLYAHGPQVSGQKSFYTATWKNAGTRAVQGRLQWGFTNLQSYENVMQGSVNFDTLQATYLSGIFSAPPLSSGAVTIVFQNATCSPGDSLLSWVRVYDMQAHPDANVWNNTATATATAQATGAVQNAAVSYDPFNTQAVFSGQAPVRFTGTLQNTSGAVADHLVWIDSLPPCVDPLSIEPTDWVPDGSGVLLTCSQGNVVRVYANNVLLPDTASGDVWSRFHNGLNTRLIPLCQNSPVEHYPYWRSSCSSMQPVAFYPAAGINLCGVDTLFTSAAQCSNSVYYYNTLPMPMPGDYFFNEATASGCNYIRHLQVQYFSPQPDSSEILVVCQNLPTQIAGQTYSISTDTVIHSLLPPAACPRNLQSNVYVLPKPTLSQSSDTVFCITNYNILQWVDCASGSNLGNAGSSFYVPAAGMQVAVVFDNGFCTDTTDCMPSLVTGIESNARPKLFWSESEGHWYVQGLSRGAHALEVFDMKGASLGKQKMTGTSAHLQSFLLPPGVYVLSTGEGNLKWVKTR